MNAQLEPAQHDSGQAERAQMAQHAQEAGSSDYVPVAVVPLDYHDMDARMEHAVVLAARARVLPEHHSMEPRLSSGFRMPDQAVSITGADSPLLDAPHGEAISLLDAEGVLGMLWYGPNDRIDDAIELLVEQLVEQLADTEEQQGWTDAQYVIGKWRHSECDRALLGLFGGGEHAQAGMPHTLASQAELVLLHDDSSAFGPVEAGRAIEATGVGPDEVVALFELLLDSAIEEADRIHLMEIMELHHPNALTLRLDEAARRDWVLRMSYTD